MLPPQAFSYNQGMTKLILNQAKSTLTKVFFLLFIALGVYFFLQLKYQILSISQESRIVAIKEIGYTTFHTVENP